MQTIEISRLKLKPHALVLDAGCGGGRHLRTLSLIPALYVVGLDLNWQDLCACRDDLACLTSAERPKEGRPPDPDASIRASGAHRGLVVKGSVAKLPFRDEAFDAVICSEVLEHIDDYEAAMAELVRVLKPGGRLALSVPRYLPERICWLISPAYHQEPGGHVRIYRKKELYASFARLGLNPFFQNYKHALHVPYWWLKCLVGHKNDRARLVVIYRRFLEWDIMKGPFLTRFLEKLLNPILGKSIVFYLRKG